MRRGGFALANPAASILQTWVSKTGLRDLADAFGSENRNSVAQLYKLLAVSTVLRTSTQ